MTSFYHRLDLTCDAHGSEPNLEAVYVGSSQLLLCLLRGWTPIISQTQAFDTLTVLGSAAADSEDGSSFRSLVQSGRIRFALYNSANVRDAFIQKLENPKYVFASWPELNSGEVDKAQVIEAVREKNSRTRLPDDLRRQLETLHALDDVLSKSRAGVVVAKDPRESLNRLLSRTARHAADVKARSAAALVRMATTKSDEWSVCYRALQAGDYEIDARAEALSILNICYDQVLADSLRVHRFGMFTESSTAAHLMGTVLPKSKTGSIFAHSPVRVPGAQLTPGEARDLQQVGWTDVKKFLDQYADLREDQTIRHASAAKLIAKVATEEGGRLAVWPRRLNVAYRFAVIVGGPVASTFLEPIIGGSAGWLLAAAAAYQPEQHIRQLLNWRLQRKYHALLCSGTDDREISRPYNRL